MYQTIQAPQHNPARMLIPLFNRAAALWTRWQARRAEKSILMHLRKFDRHLGNDIDLDREALWQPRPEIRRLQSGIAVAAGCRDADTSRRNG